MVINISLFNILIIGTSLAMDAVSVVIANSLINDNHKFHLKMSIIFGFFQFFMCYLGSYFGNYIINTILGYQNIFSFLVFTIIGINILFSKESIIYIDNNITLLLLGFITSIDAFSVGVTFSFYNEKILLYSIIIGITTFIMCILSSYFCLYVSKYYSKYCHIFGGLLLIIIGLLHLLTSF